MFLDIPLLVDYAVHFDFKMKLVFRYVFKHKNAISHVFAYRKFLDPK